MTCAVVFEHPPPFEISSERRKLGSDDTAEIMPCWRKACSLCAVAGVVRTQQLRLCTSPLRTLPTHPGVFLHKRMN